MRLFNDSALFVARGIVLGAGVAIVPTILIGLVELEWRLPNHLKLLYSAVGPGVLIAFWWGGDDYHSDDSFIKASVIFGALANAVFGALVGAVAQWIWRARRFQFHLKSLFWIIAAFAAALVTRDWWWIYAWMLVKFCAAWWATLTAIIALVMAIDWKIRVVRLTRSTRANGPRNWTPVPHRLTRSRRSSRQSSEPDVDGYFRGD